MKRNYLINSNQFSLTTITLRLEVGNSPTHPSSSFLHRLLVLSTWFTSYVLFYCKLNDELSITINDFITPNSNLRTILTSLNSPIKFWSKAFDAVVEGAASTVRVRVGFRRGSTNSSADSSSDSTMSLISLTNPSKVLVWTLFLFC